jgi:diguanylate cyclase (GGDEF)-like protein
MLEILYAATGLFAAAAIGNGVALYLCRKRLAQSRGQAAKLEEDLKAARSLDEVTGAFNYPFFVKMANVQIKLGRRHKWPMTLMIIDIDQLEKVNVRYSFKTGDAVLKHLAESINSVIRSSDVPGRFGGSGIFLLLPECDVENIETVFERIEQKRKESPLKMGDKIIDYRVSAGSVTMYGMQAHLNRMLELSEEALNRAKEKRKELIKFDKEGVEI